MFRGLILCAILLSPPTFAGAQQRVMNPDAPGVVRAWPVSGKWLVTLSRSAEGALFCAIGTGHQEPRLDDSYVWGLRWRDGTPGLFISDRREEALAGTGLRIAVDGSPVGEFPIDRRRRAVGMATITAGLTDADARKLLGVMGVGASMTFSTKTANYVAPLEGARLALANVEECNQEARSLRPSPP